MDFINLLLPTIEHFRLLGYWIVLLVALLESLAFIGIIVPGTAFIVLVGFAAAKGYLDLGDVIWFAAIGSIMGDLISYYFGLHAKKFFSDSNRLFRLKYFDKGRNFFKEYGGRSILLGRFIGPIRPIIPFVAGMFKMEKQRFFLLNVLSGFVWAITFLLVGFFFGQAWESIAMWSARGSIFIASLFGFIFIIYLIESLMVKKGKQILSFLNSVWKSIKDGVVNNKEVRKLANRHSRLFKFLGQRLDKSRFWGLPATVLFLAFIYIVFLFIGVVEDVLTTEVIVLFDIRVNNLLAVFRNAELTKFFLWVTLLGKWKIVLGFMVATGMTLWAWGKRFYIISLFLTVFGSGVFTMLGKIAVHRSRPELAIYTESSYSFPSGHATMAVAFYGFLAYILMREFKRWRAKVNIFFTALVIISFIGFSRLYLGVHYVSDVWGGYLVGLLWVVIGISIAEWLSSKQKIVSQVTPKLKIKIIAVSLVILSFVFYILFAVRYNPQVTQPAVVEENIELARVRDIFITEKLKYTETVVGNKQEPLSFIILAKNDDIFIQSFIRSGWVLADEVNLSSIIKLAKAAAYKQAYPKAPMTPSFWDEKTHNLGFEKETAANNARERHHVRFWKTNYIMEDGRNVYVGTASLDSNIKWGITHTINPDIDTEREFLFSNLSESGVVQNFRKEKLVKPVLGANFAGDLFFTDGEVYIIEF